MADGDTSTHERPHVFSRAHARLHRNPITGLLTKIVITIVGVAIMVLGVFMSGPGIPGPGFLVILGGLAILSSEYDWAKRVLEWAKERYEKAKERMGEMDPAVRRRRLWLTLAAMVIVSGALTAYVVVYDWPTFAVSGWDWLQGLSGVLPELPGM